MRARLRPLPGLLALLLAGPLMAARAAGDEPVPVPAGTPAPASPSPAIMPGAAPAPAPAPAETIILLDPAIVAAPGEAGTLAEPAPMAATALPVQPVRRGEEVFTRIRRGLGSNVCAAGDSSERWRRRYASNPAAFAHRLEQILPLLDFVSLEVERAGLPSEFSFIPLVESWYKPEAMGVRGPAGMWQMIGTTARNHGIHIQSGYDGRLSPVESTRAALSYLKVLHAMFGGWEATVMAYNAGEGRMMQAFKRARSRDTSGDRRRPHGLSNITYDYVAKLQALSCLVDQPDRNNLRLPRATRFVPLAPVLMEAGVSSLDQFASRRGRTPDALRRLNPGYREGRVVAGVPRLVLMPLGATLPETDAIASAPIASTPAGMTPGLPPADGLALASPIPLTGPDAAITPTPDPAPAANQAAVVGDAEVVQIAPEAKMVEVSDMAPATTHRVLAGESVWTIARLHQLSTEQLRRLNGLDRRAVVHPGQALKLVP